ncbi:hypothetical protein D3C84_686320 [compost metagenome]
MEVVKLLFVAFSLIDPRQWRIATRLIQVQTALSRSLLPQHPQPLPEKAFLLGLAVDLRLFGAFQLAVDQCLGTNQAVFTVVAEALQLAMPRALFDQVAPGIVTILLIPPLPDAVARCG